MKKITVQLDADWVELLDIAVARTRGTTCANCGLSVTLHLHQRGDI